MSMNMRGAARGVKRQCWLVLAFLLSANVVAGAATLRMPSRGVQAAAAAANESLGEFTLLSESATEGNALTLLYGSSVQGGELTTYWENGQMQMSVIPTGNNQYELVESVGRRCLTVTGAVVDTTTCTGSPEQLMTLSVQADGSYTIASQGECVEAPSSFSLVAAQPCNASSGQKWTFSGSVPLVLSPAPVTTAPATGTTLGSWSLLNEGASEGNSLTLSYGVSREGNSLTTYWASSQAGFSVVSMANNQYELVENTGGRCVTASSSSVDISTCSGSASQLFSLGLQTDGSYEVEGGGGICIEAPSAFASVSATPCSGAATQRWVFSGATPLGLPAAKTPANPTPTPPPSPTVPAGYHLTFDDEFGSLSISDRNGAGTKWYTHTVQCCLYDTSSPSTPTYMAGITAPKGQDPYSLVSGGLDIRLQKTNGAWYSGVIATVDGTGKGFAQQYGYFEMKAKFPAGPGTWPAFWLLNQAALTQQAPAGEIDVVESYMQFPTYINTTLHNWTPPATTPAYQQASVANLSNGFHTFGMLWTASTMTFYCDGVKLYSFATPSIMNQPYYPIIDLGLGGGWPTAQTPQQSDMIVQYMRVYAP